MLPTPADHVTLRFSAADAGGHDIPVHRDLSAVARYEDTLFLGCDETAGIEVLDPEDGDWGRHRHVDLAEFTDLPEDDGEMDIEGMDVDDGWLWLTGSHSLKRNKPDADDPPEAALADFAELKFDPNRQFLGRVPLAAGAVGLRPVAEAGDRRVAHLKFGEWGKLRDWLEDDPYIGPYLGIPSKENGLDIEGLAARGDRVWLGLRGPVLRGYGVIVELSLKQTAKGHLKARRIDGKRRYRLHLLPTSGEGLRDLVVDGNDLMVLVGTAMAGDGPSALLRWHDGVRVEKSGLRPEAEISVELDLPYRGLTDNPEGLVRWDETHWLIVHDSPEDARLPADRAIRADLWPVARGARRRHLR